MRVGRWAGKTANNVTVHDFYLFIEAAVASKLEEIRVAQKVQDNKDQS